MTPRLLVLGASEHDLRHLDLDLPRDALLAVTDDPVSPKSHPVHDPPRIHQ